eukprot:TRINITY_DN11059_c0_g2_i2.p1 TRINITY_DN11059_c0_g2~~TRINITY_DN11059_c0_g2_i2.p1  ORF type:complete len:100 (-),score=3.60 TRINITY_DN11059_c0_g2_i2:25-324(-)
MLKFFIDIPNKLRAKINPWKHVRVNSFSTSTTSHAYMIQTLQPHELLSRKSEDNLLLPINPTYVNPRAASTHHLSRPNTCRASEYSSSGSVQQAANPRR